MKTTKAHYDEFKRHHAEYVRRFGLLEWAVQYRHALEDEGYACTEPKFKGKVATVTLATDWGEVRPVNSRELRKVAKHEAIHLLTYSLYWHAAARYISPDTLEEAEHALVRTLDQLIPD